jgi:hypothetical protein
MQSEIRQEGAVCGKSLARQKIGGFLASKTDQPVTNRSEFFKNMFIWS